MNNISLQTYGNYSTYMNKENISSSIKEPILHINTTEKKDENKKVEQVNESRKASNEEVVALYYNRQANQAYMSVIDTLFNEQNEDETDSLTYKDMRELYFKKNIHENIEDYYNEQPSIQNNKLPVEIWA